MLACHICTSVTASIRRLYVSQVWNVLCHESIVQSILLHIIFLHQTCICTFSFEYLAHRLSFLNRTITIDYLLFMLALFPTKRRSLCEITVSDHLCWPYRLPTPPRLARISTTPSSTTFRQKSSPVLLRFSRRSTSTSRYSYSFWVLRCACSSPSPGKRRRPMVCASWPLFIAALYCLGWPASSA